MYKSLNSTTLRQLGLRRNVIFRHVNQPRPITATSPFVRLVILRPNAASQRGLHLSRDLLRSETKLGKTVAAEEKETMTSRAAALAKEQQAAKLAAASGTVSTTSASTAIKPKKTLWQKVKAEAVHYWHGTQLLGLEIRISSSLTWKLLNGGKLTRREHRQVRDNSIYKRS
jgi:hypothetical protein